MAACPGLMRRSHHSATCRSPLESHGPRDDAPRRRPPHNAAVQQAESHREGGRAGDHCGQFLWSVVQQEDAVAGRLAGDLVGHHQPRGCLQPHGEPVALVGLPPGLRFLRSVHASRYRKCSTSMMLLPSSSYCGNTSCRPSGVTAAPLLPMRRGVVNPVFFSRFDRKS